MAHHAFVLEGSADDVMEEARGYAARLLSLTGRDNPDILVFRYNLFSVDDARHIWTVAGQSGTGAQKMIVMYAARLFHESQNALLKAFEEPPEGVTLVLGVPSLGMLLPTLRSRLMPLPCEGKAEREASIGRDDPSHEFLTLKPMEREKFITKLIDRYKSDKEEIKAAARTDAILLLHSLAARAHAQAQDEKNMQIQAELRDFMKDLTVFAPILHERSIPLKLIFEHVLLTLPKGLV